MSTFRRHRRQRIDERAIDALLSGTTPAGRPELAELAAFADAVRELSAAAPPPDAELAAVFSGGLDDVTSTQPAPVAVPRRLARHTRSRKMIEALTAAVGTALGKVALVGGVAVASVGGAYAAGVEVPGLPPQANPTAVEATETRNVDVQDIEPQEVESQQDDGKGEAISEQATSTNPSTVTDRDSWTGRDFGASIADQASDGRATEAREEAEARAEAGRQTGEDRSTEGRANAPVEPAGAETGEQASQEGAASAPVDVPAGPGTGDEHREEPPADAETGMERSAEGRDFGGSAATDGQSRRP